MKILLCHDLYQGRGGEEQGFFHEKDILEKRGHTIVLFTKDNREIQQLSLFGKLRVLLNVVFSLGVYRELKKIVLREKPDVAHIHNVFPLITPSIYYLLKRMKVPIVQTVHNYRFFCPNGLFLTNDGKICERCQKGNYLHAVRLRCYRESFWQSAGMAFILFVHRCLKTFVSKIDIFICPSEFLRKKIIEGGIPEDKTVVKPYIIGCEKIKPSVRTEGYAVYMGRLSAEKGLMTLLRAWKGVLQIDLKIIGTGDIQDDLKRYVLLEKMNNVEFLGFIEGWKRYEFLQKALFLIAPSEWYENMPNIVLESLACGLPVIASRIGGLAELIEHDKNGFLFQMGNSDDLREKIFYLVNHPDKRKEMSRYARLCVETKYASQSNYVRLMAIYQKATRDRQSLRRDIP